MRAVFAGGGTAGHIMPGIVIGKRIMREFPGSEVLFFTLRRNMDFGPLAGSGFRVAEINAGGFVGKSPLVMALSFFDLARGFLKSLKGLINFNPDVIIGNGGYASAPAVMAGIVLRHKVILLEQNFVPGLTTRFFARFVDEVELSFPGSEKASGISSYRITGNPVRPEIVSAEREKSLGRLNLSGLAPVLVIMGGSSGAASLNLAMEKVLKKACGVQRLKEVFSAWQVIHIAGAGGYEHMLGVYRNSGVEARVFSFFEEIWHVYACADLIVSRCGGNSAAEIAARGIPAVYAPYPLAGNHQELNARTACGLGSAVMIRDGELCTEKFSSLLLSLMTDSARREKMKCAGKSAAGRDAAGAIMERIMEITGGTA